MRKAGFSISEVALFAEGRAQTKRKSIRDTLEKEGDAVNVRLWGHRIATVGRNEMRVSSAGWQTNTTKERLNKLLPEGHRVFQKKFRWFMSKPGGKVVPFEDEMRIKLR